MKNIYYLSILLLFNNLSAQKVVSDSIRSQKLNAYRTFSVSLPKSYERNKDKTYPLIICLDGEYLFETFKNTLKFGNYWGELPEAIIVGINQNKKDERTKDCVVDDMSGLPIKTGANFFDFFNMELLPQLTKQYRLGTFKILAGHELTAGFLNLYLFRTDNPFRGFIAMSPELNGDIDQGIINKLSKFKTPVYYYFSTADGDDTVIQKKAAAMDLGLSSIQNPNAFYKFDNFKNASHYSLILNSVPNALYHIFKGFPPISIAEYDEKIATLPNGYVEYLNKKYETIEKSFGIKMPVRFNDIKAVETAILKNGNAVNELEELAVVANKNYPKAMLGEYYVALYFEKRGDPKRAQKSYLAAYNMEPLADLTKEIMYEKSEEMRRLVKKGGGKLPPPEAASPEPAPAETVPEEKK